MSRIRNKFALVDTCFWRAYLEEDDPHHPDAMAKIDGLMRLRYFLPWPILYETLHASVIRHPGRLRSFEKIFHRPNAIPVDDAPYRSQALRLTLPSSRGESQLMSVVDNVLCLIIDDKARPLDYMYTYNHRDFRQVCVRRRVQLI